MLDMSLYTYVLQIETHHNRMGLKECYTMLLLIAIFLLGNDGYYENEHPIHQWQFSTLEMVCTFQKECNRTFYEEY